jgi:hypothetical protein
VTFGGGAKYLYGQSRQLITALLNQMRTSVASFRALYAVGAITAAELLEAVGGAVAVFLAGVDLPFLAAAGLALALAAGVALFMKCIYNYSPQPLEPARGLAASAGGRGAATDLVVAHA